MKGRGDGELSDHDEQLLTPGAVADMFRVEVTTVARWERSGRISAVRTLGGHRRFRRGEIERALQTASAAGA